MNDSDCKYCPIKNSKRTRRIDGVAAMLDAYVVLRDKINEYVGVI